MLDEDLRRCTAALDLTRPILAVWASLPMGPRSQGHWTLDKEFMSHLETRDCRLVLFVTTDQSDFLGFFFIRPKQY